MARGLASRGRGEATGSPRPSGKATPSHRVIAAAPTVPGDKKRLHTHLEKPSAKKMRRKVTMKCPPADESDTVIATVEPLKNSETSSSDSPSSYVSSSSSPSSSSSCSSSSSPSFSCASSFCSSVSEVKESTEPKVYTRMASDVTVTVGGLLPGLGLTASSKAVGRSAGEVAGGIGTGPAAAPVTSGPSTNGCVAEDVDDPIVEEHLVVLEFPELANTQFLDQQTLRKIHQVMNNLGGDEDPPPFGSRDTFRNEQPASKVSNNARDSSRSPAAATAATAPTAATAATAAAATTNASPADTATATASTATAVSCPAMCASSASSSAGASISSSPSPGSGCRSSASAHQDLSPSFRDSECLPCVASCGEPLGLPPSSASPRSPLASSSSSSSGSRSASLRFFPSSSSTDGQAIAQLNPGGFRFVGRRRDPFGFLLLLQAPPSVSRRRVSAARRANVTNAFLRPHNALASDGEATASETATYNYANGTGADSSEIPPNDPTTSVTAAGAVPSCSTAASPSSSSSTGCATLSLPGSAPDGEDGATVALPPPPHSSLRKTRSRRCGWQSGWVASPRTNVSLGRALANATADDNEGDVTPTTPEARHEETEKEDGAQTLLLVGHTTRVLAFELDAPVAQQTV
eukprot:GHVT01098135.1.p1 GENE.GHVT01098135.1~~GHVT01098135.1.p1  ORF type:complete len:636 (+),score=146.84 GHVT01098135.1:226-2133(+)